MGFSPINNPSFLVVVTISGTTGTAGFGAYAAGPPFTNIANTALRIREVQRDVPEEVEEITQKELAQNGPEITRATQGTSGFLPCLVARSRALCAQKELVAKEKLKDSQKTAAAADPLAALSTPPTDEEIREATGNDSGAEDAAGGDAQTVVAAAGPKVPDFVGKTVKDAMQQALADGIDLEIEGDGLARSQYPAVGTPLAPNERVRVKFSR